jgi:phage protein D
MAVVTLSQESVDQGAFYAPRYEVRIEGVGLPRDVLRDVISLTYKDDIKSIDSFELTVNNWDTATGDFKYIGAETTTDLNGSSDTSARYKLFEPCNKEAKVSMGYLDEMRVMLIGNFTTMEPNFPSSGAPTLTVRGLNVLHQLRRKQYSSDWADKKDSEIAEDIARKVDKDTGKKRFPLPIVIDPAAKDQEPVLEYVNQQNQYDIDFLLARARRRGYVMFVQEPDPDVRGSQKRLYFGPSQTAPVPGLRDVTFELEWGKSLIDFKPTLTTANQFKSVTVTGWNRRTAKPIKETVSLDDPKLNRNKDLYRLLEACDPREEYVVNKPVFNEKEAKALALATLMDRQKEMVKCSATTVGLPDLRAGRTVRILGVGARFSGVYFITDTTHTINDSGYVTKFNARREDDGAGAK